MQQPVQKEFQAGNFAVKHSLHSFNQVDTTRARSGQAVLAKKEEEPLESQGHLQLLAGGLCPSTSDPILPITPEMHLVWKQVMTAATVKPQKAERNAIQMKKMPCLQSWGDLVSSQLTCLRH